MNVRADLAQRREELHAVIRAAAIAEFAEHGLRGASTQGIADRAGISKTKLHYYITSKEDLYQEVLDHIIGLWDDLFHETPDSDDPEGFLRDYIARKLLFSLEYPDVSRVFTSEVMRGAPMLRAHWDASRTATGRAADRIAGWVAAGLIRPVDPWLLQFNIWSLTQAYALHATEVRFMLGLDDDAPLDLDHITQEVTQLVLRGLRP